VRPLHRPIALIVRQRWVVTLTQCHSHTRKWTLLSHLSQAAISDMIDLVVRHVVSRRVQVRSGTMFHQIGLSFHSYFAINFGESWKETGKWVRPHGAKFDSTLCLFLQIIFMSAHGQPRFRSADYVRSISNPFFFVCVY
jgi:hypothetical protein